MTRPLTGCLAVLLALSGASATGAGVFVRSTGTQGSGETTIDLSLDRTAVRIDSGGEASGHTAIFRRDEQVFWIIDHRKKTYMEMTRQDLEDMAAQLGQLAEARKMIDAQMANVPPEQRKMMEEMMKGRMPPGMSFDAVALAPPEYRKVESGVSVGSWTCDRWEGLVDGVKVAEVWTAKPEDVGISSADFEVLREMGNLFEDLVKTVGEAFPQMQGLAGATGGFDGLPLKQVRYEGGKEASRNVVEEIRNREFDPALFQRPVGYTKNEPVKELRGH